MVLADSEEHADRIAQLGVKVSYSNIQPPISTIHDAIAKKSFSGRPHTSSTGDVDSGFAAAAHVFSGATSSKGQYHFYMETQTAVVSLDPMTQGIKVITSTQSPASVQGAVARAVNLPMSKVALEVARVGGGYGGKLGSGPVTIAVPCAHAALKHKAEVRCRSKIKDCMSFVGKRAPAVFSYKVGCDASGKVLAVQGMLYVENFRASGR